ncbi:MAG: hypothetical protein WC878_02615 [Candidatus Paceibacterota bacterium]|jgi:hypothetical protein
MEEPRQQHPKREVCEPTRGAMIFLCVVLFLMFFVVPFVFYDDAFLRTASLITLLAMINVPGRSMAKGRYPKKKKPRRMNIREIRKSLLE